MTYSLKTCDACKKEYSLNEKFCPTCKHPNNAPTETNFKKPLKYGAVFILLLLILNYFPYEYLFSSSHSIDQNADTSEHDFNRCLNQGRDYYMKMCFEDPLPDGTTIESTIARKCKNAAGAFNVEMDQQDCEFVKKTYKKEK